MYVPGLFQLMVAAWLSAAARTTITSQRPQTFAAFNATTASLIKLLRASSGGVVKNAPHVDGKPPVFSKRLTFSMHEKATLRAVVEAITNTTHSGNVYGDGIDLMPAIGGACLLQLTENKKPDGSEGRKIQAVMPVDPDAPKPERVNPIRTFNLDAYDDTIYQGLPQFLKDLIAKSPEYQAANGNAIEAAMPGINPDAPFDDIPY